MQVSSSRSLVTELSHITRQGWHTKLFILTEPDPWTRNPIALAGVALMRAISHTPRAKWNYVVDDFRAAGLILPNLRPTPGSIFTFDSKGDSVILISGIVTPEDAASVIRSRIAIVEDRLATS